MPGAIAAGAAAISAIVAAAQAAPILTAVILGFVTSVASSFLQQAMMDDPSTPSDVTAGLRVNSRTSNAVLPVIYGTMRVGGNFAFIGSEGKVLLGEEVISNAYLWAVLNISEGENDSIYQDGGVDQVYLGDKVVADYAGKAAFWFHAGASDQTYDTNLNAKFSDWTDNQRYTSYLVVKLQYDPKYFQSLPTISPVVKGRKLYDFRDESTAWSNNPVLALYDYMTNTRYGRGLSADKIDVTSWTSAANYCDTKGFEINVSLNTAMAAQDVEDMICKLFRGQKVWFDGKFYLRYSDLNYESSQMTINDEHVLQDGNGKAVIKMSQPTRFDLPDALRVRFIDAALDWVEDSVLVGDSLGVVKEVRMDGCTDREAASNMGIYMLERLKLNRGVTLTGRDDLAKLEPNDVVTLNSTALSISDQLMRVTSCSMNGLGQVDLSLVYEATSLYDDDYDIVTADIYTCTLPDPTQVPLPVQNVTVTEETYYYRLRNFTRLLFSFTDPSDDFAWWDHVEVYMSWDNVTWKHLFDANSSFEVQNVEEGVKYYFRLKSVSSYGVKQEDADDTKISLTVQGYTDTPESLTSLDAVVNSNTINLYSAKVDDPDIELYEFRLGASWIGGIFLAALRSPNFSLYGVKPGTHTFWVNTLSNNGEYGDDPQSATVTLIDPPDGWTVQETETCDYDDSGEDHSNTEQYVYDTDDYLRCAHGSAGLTGVYTSPVYDLGESDRYLIYLLADIAVIGTGTTWDDQFPDDSVTSTTWDEGEISTRTWRQIFELAAGPSVSIKLLFGDTSPPTSEVGRLEIMSAIATGRYFQIEITITDPSSEVYALIENFELKFCQ